MSHDSSPQTVDLRAWFNGIAEVYPRGAKLDAAFTAFCRLHPDAELVTRIHADIERKKRTVWGGVEPRFIPHLRNYFHDRRWLDAEDMSPVSQAELDAARRIRSSRFLGRCPHSTTCASDDDCLKTLALRLRESPHRRSA